ncbi:PAS domain-containing protein [Gymnodinialimonas ceratoperidinii]|uniref:histidine kinase n=1 Tax=Gymnodinialimonas ceratoperidinii TaxID=2856823 RepID=A0A8F6YBG4_9RHOB|nr:PAS domain-containing protein [Gymnodinialimonas ceratoperidinii]QXT38152.1 PAS domain-containing protein [Gymnodinialimonas ceratoperidinii]
MSALTMRRNNVFEHAIRHSRLPLCISDPSLPDMPIVFANEAFCNLTGYSVDDILGRNCRFLQGPETTPESVQEIRDALASHEVTMVELVNYRKNGEKFINALQLGPVFDDDGKLIYFFGSQLDVTEARERERREAALRTSELVHRLRNIVNVMHVVIKISGRSETDIKAYGEKIANRLVALGQAHLDTLTDEQPKFLKIRDLAHALLLAYAPLGEQQFKFKGPDLELPHDTVTTLTLLLHELATNAVKHGSLGAVGGVVELEWAETDDEHLHLKWRERFGPTVVKPTRKSGLGIVETLITTSSGKLSFDWDPEGLVVDLMLPK